MQTVIAVSSISCAASCSCSEKQGSFGVLAAIPGAVNRWEVDVFMSRVEGDPAKNAGGDELRNRHQNWSQVSGQQSQTELSLRIS